MDNGGEVTGAVRPSPEEHSFNNQKHKTVRRTFNPRQRPSKVEVSPVREALNSKV